MFYSELCFENVFMGSLLLDWGHAFCISANPLSSDLVWKQVESPITSVLGELKGAHSRIDLLGFPFDGDSFG